MEISPQSRNVRRFIKCPMLMQVICAALLSGMSVALFKFFGELIQSASDNYFFIVLLCTIGLSVATLQMHMTSCAMKYYDQIEVQPVYQTAIMFGWILSGMIIFQETELYTTKQLVIIFCCCIVCFIGIYFLFIKKKRGKSMDKTSEVDTTNE